ncbi:MAG: large-conductance mechanosensitive channel protein MscL [bacterium]|nr:large-conductance mechanosensitive channel protein MscL [bacterium]
MPMLKDFKDFAMRGNVLDMAVGIIIGGAFGKIISSLVTDVIMPPIGLAMGGVDFSNLMVTLKKAEETKPAVALRYGVFINTVIDFIIVAFAIFMMVRIISGMKRKQAQAPAAPPQPTNEELLLKEIRDILKNQK